MQTNSPFQLAVLYIAIVSKAVSTLLGLTPSSISYFFCQVSYVVELKYFVDYYF
jgi:hypothetical protein